MRNFYRGIAWSTGLALTLGWAVSANAAINNAGFNGSVSSATSLYFGTGNTNRGFTIDRETGGLELGLRAHTRYPFGDDSVSTSPTPGLMNQGNGTYGSFDPIGYFPGTPGIPGGPRSSWNFDFSINTNYDGTGTDIGASGLHFALLIDSDPGFGVSFIPATGFDPLAIPDNGYGDNGAKDGNGLAATFIGTNNVAQNSQNVAFFPVAINPFSNGLYDIALVAYNANNVEVGRAQIEVLVGTVPEPASMAIWGLGALGCAVAGYRRRKLAA